MIDQVDHLVAIDPSEFYKAFEQSGLNKLVGCTITHFLFGSGIIRSIDDLLRIHLFSYMKKVAEF